MKRLGFIVLTLSLAMSFCYAAEEPKSTSKELESFLKDSKTQTPSGDAKSPETSGSAPATADKDKKDDEKDKNADAIKEAQEAIAKVNPDQKGGYVAEIWDKGTLADVSGRHPEFFNDKVRSGNNPVEIGKMIEFDENGKTLSENLYVKGGGNGNQYGTDKPEYMGMPYGKSSPVWQGDNGASQTWSDNGGDWTNPNKITTRVSSNPDRAIMSPYVTTERVHTISSSGVTAGCYGLLSPDSSAAVSYGLNSNLGGMVNFANSRVQLGLANGVSSNYNQSLAGYRTKVRGV